MSFSLFNHTQAIQTLNLQGRAFVPNETFGLRSLSDAATAFIQQGLFLYRDNYLRYSGVSGKKSSAYQAELRAAKTQSPHDALKTLRRVQREVIEDNKKRREFAWRNQQAEVLSQPAIWQQLENATSNALHQAQIRERGAQWQFIGPFLHYHPQALLDAYQLLPRLKQFFKQALDELESRQRGYQWFKPKIPDGFYQAYHTYLIAQLKLIDSEYQIITTAMLQRLQLAARERLMASDVLLASIAELKQHGVLNSQFANTITPQASLTVQQFHGFHDAIDAHGDNAIRQQLSELPWFSPNTQLATLAPWFTLSTQVPSNILPTKPQANAHTTASLSNSRQRLAKRFNVSHLIPKEPRWPAGLFVGANLRYHFFDDFFSIANADAAIQQAINESEKDTLTLDKLSQLNISQQAAWRALSQETQRTNKAFNQINRWPWSWLNDKTFQLIDGYRDVISQQRSQLIGAHIDVLQRLAGRIEWGVLAPERATHNEQQQIHASIDWLEKRITSLKPAGSLLKARFTQVKIRVLNAIQTHHDTILRQTYQQQQIVRQDQLLSPLQQSTPKNPATLNQVDTLLTYTQGLKTTDDAATQDFLKQLDILVDKACQDMHVAFAPRYQPLTSKSKSINGTEGITDKQLAHYAITQGQLIQALGKAPERIRLDQALQHYAFAYLERWSGTSPRSTSAPNKKTPTLTLDEHHRLSQAQEQVILTLGSDTLTQPMQKLQSLRLNGQYNELGHQAAQLKKQIEQQIVNQQLRAEIKRLDTTLFAYLKRMPELNMSAHGLHYLTQLSDRLSDENIQDVTTYTHLTATDKAFLGMSPQSPWAQFTDTVISLLTCDPHSPRQTLIAVVNCCATLRIEAKRLPYIRSLDEQANHVAKIKQMIEGHIQRYGNQHLAQRVKHSGLFAQLNPQSTTDKTLEIQGYTQLSHTLTEDTNTTGETSCLK